MKKQKNLFGSLLVMATLAFTACQSSEELQKLENEAKPELQLATVDQTEGEETFNFSTTTEMPADYLFYSAAVESLINPSDYECNSTGIPFNNYVNSTVANWDMAAFQNYGNGANFVTYYYLYLADGENQYYGSEGQYTNVMNRTFKDLKRFWNIYSDDIVMTGMHGNILSNTEEMTKMFQFVYGLDEASANFYAAYFAQIFGSEAFWNYNHPLLSLNAFAFSTSNPGFPDKIVMGDGIMESYDAIGFGDVAPQAILAHEFGHHIQYENDYFENVPAQDRPNATRRTELMADAYAAYYLTHKRGATMNWKRVQQFMEVFFNIGDCSFSSSSHHGTHNQRLAAAQFGYDVAKAAQKQGHILSSEAFYELFEAKLPELIAPDAN